jgi:hypothetical protein
MLNILMNQQKSGDVTMTNDKQSIWVNIYKTIYGLQVSQPYPTEQQAKTKNGLPVGATYIKTVEISTGEMKTSEPGIYRKAALETIHEYYYMLPNNGYLNSGINSCESRFKEAIECAIIGTKRTILTLEFMSLETSDPAVMGRLNWWDEVLSELYKIKNNDGKISLSEVMDLFK